MKTSPANATKTCAARRSSRSPVVIPAGWPAQAGCRAGTHTPGVGRGGLDICENWISSGGVGPGLAPGFRRASIRDDKEGPGRSSSSPFHPLISCQPAGRRGGVSSRAPKAPHAGWPLDETPPLRRNPGMKSMGWFARAREHPNSDTRLSGRKCPSGPGPQGTLITTSSTSWVPAFAGMTVKRRRQALPRRRYQLPVFSIEAQGSCGGRLSPRCRSSTEIPSGERTKAIWPSRGGRLIV